MSDKNESLKEWADTETNKMYAWYLQQKEEWEKMVNRIHGIEKSFTDMLQYDNYTELQFNCCAVCQQVSHKCKMGDWGRALFEGYHCNTRNSKVPPTGICQRFLREEFE